MKSYQILIVIMVIVIILILISPSIAQYMYYTSVNERMSQLDNPISDKNGRICASSDYQMWNKLCKPRTGFYP